MIIASWNIMGMNSQIINIKVTMQNHYFLEFWKLELDLISVKL